MSNPIIMDSTTGHMSGNRNHDRQRPDYYDEDTMLIGSTPGDCAGSTAMPQWHTHKDVASMYQSNTPMNPSCLPFGFCYDDETRDLDDEQLPSDAVAMLPNTEDEFMLGSKSINLHDYCKSFWPSSGSVNYFNHDDIKVEDAFQTDKLDLKSGPTLAELNLTDDIWNELDLDELIVNSNTRKRFCPEKRIQVQPQRTTTVDPKLQENIDYLTQILLGPQKSAQNSLTSSPNIIPSATSYFSTNTTSLDRSSSFQNFEIPVNNTPVLQHSTVLSSLLSNPTLPPVVKKEIEEAPPDILEPLDTAPPSTEPNEESTKRNSRKRNSSMSTECSGSDEGFASQPEESDNEDDENSSDDESFYGDYGPKDLLGASTSDDANNKWALNMGRSRKGGQQRYFWQYNVQSKGPKGTRIASVGESNGDPHVLCEASDPVFSPDCRIQGVKHAGKARRGDGNDLTPNPKKLLMIGLELKKLSRVINELTPVAEVPIPARNTSRKEKNKLASRACRLKKKAQHEANKIKLYGLQQEHKNMLSLLIEVKKMIKKQMDKTECLSPIGVLVDQLITENPTLQVAGKTTEFVNSVLDNVADGLNNGGLEKL